MSQNSTLSYSVIVTQKQKHSVPVMSVTFEADPRFRFVDLASKSLGESKKIFHDSDEDEEFNGTLFEFLSICLQNTNGENGQIYFKNEKLDFKDLDLTEVSQFIVDTETIDVKWGKKNYDLAGLIEYEF